jgi:transposase-like protein
VLDWVMQPISYARHRFPPDIIQHAVWLYLRFTFSYRDVEDLLAKRGLMVSNESIRRNRAVASPASIVMRTATPTARRILSAISVRSPIAIRSIRRRSAA